MGLHVEGEVEEAQGYRSAAVDLGLLCFICSASGFFLPSRVIFFLPEAGDYFRLK